MKVKTPESMMTASFVFLMPLTFASNVFVGVETMPGWLQVVVGHNPVTHLTSAARGLMHGKQVGSDILWVLATSAAITRHRIPHRATFVQQGALIPRFSRASVRSMQPWSARKWR